jgi:hypothetical protein
LVRPAQFQADILHGLHPVCALNIQYKSVIYEA